MNFELKRRIECNSVDTHKGVVIFSLDKFVFNNYWRKLGYVNNLFPLAGFSLFFCQHVIWNELTIAKFFLRKKK